MKKSFILATAAVALGLGMGSCCGSGSCGTGVDSLVSKSKSDSVSTFFGRMTGGFINNELNYYAEQQGEEFDRQEFLKGVQSVVGRKHSEAYYAGVGTGLRLGQDMLNMEAQGVQVNRDKFLAAFRELVLSDSVSDEQRNEYAAIYQQLNDQIQAEAVAREEAKKAQSSDAQANVKAGEEYVANLLKTNPAAKQTESGLAYVIENPGEGEKVKRGDKVTVNYVGKFLDGETFDKGEGAVFTPGSGIIEGVSEGLCLLSKGGKATVYVPASLGYGVNGVPQAKIGPNQMIVFELEVTDVNPTAEQN